MTTMPLPTHSWVSAHRALGIALNAALVLVLALAIGLVVVPAIGARPEVAPSFIPRLNTGEGSCHSILAGVAC